MYFILYTYLGIQLQFISWKIIKNTGRNPGFDRVLIEDVVLEEVVLEDVLLEDVY